MAAQVSPQQQEQGAYGLSGSKGKTGTRAKSRKSRLGCAECKAKRLKCDEKHPSCQQCVRRGKTCPGYQKQYRWSTVHEKSKPTEEDAAFWPQAEHNALIDALPQSRCCEAHIQDDVSKTSAVEEGGDPAGMSSFTLLATPESNEENELDFQQLQETTFLPPTTGEAVDTAPWPADNELDWLDDPVVTYTDDASIAEIFPDLGSPSLWPVDSQIDDEPTRPPSNAFALTPAKPPKLLYNPIDLSTMLMEYWFSDVCPMWSAFDSPANPHRQLAANVWQHSDAVFFALQSMSAACLVDSLPHVKQHVGTLSSQAVEAIQCGVRAHKQLELETAVKFPKELLLAIIAMGTSVCWTDTRQLGLWFLTKAHELLAQYEDDATRLDEHGRQELVYFREALVYWEMLYRIVGSDPQNHLRKRKRVYMKRLQRAMSMKGVSTPDAASSPQRTTAVPSVKATGGITIHPWTGVSTDIQHTFGLVILLCREHRMASKKSDTRRSASLSDALCDIQLARDLAHELAETDLYSSEPASSANVESNGTGDSITPIRHLVDTAEAYRLAALLLLSQTFPDLELEDLVDEVSSDTSRHCPSDASENLHQRQISLNLAMKLVETLRRVPAESGTRCIQPVLYICAGSGLRFTTAKGESENVTGGTRQTGSSSQTERPRSDRLDMALLSTGSRTASTNSQPVDLTQCTLEVSRGRRFVIDRLCALQRSLPPRPIGVALDLVKAIWTEYDYNTSSEQPHWIDIMVDKGLQTLFG